MNYIQSLLSHPTIRLGIGIETAKIATVYGVTYLGRFYFQINPLHTTLFYLGETLINCALENNLFISRTNRKANCPTYYAKLVANHLITHIPMILARVCGVFSTIQLVTAIGLTTLCRREINALADLITEVNPPADHPFKNLLGCFYKALDDSEDRLLEAMLEGESLHVEEDSSVLDMPGQVGSPNEGAVAPSVERVQTVEARAVSEEFKGLLSLFDERDRSTYEMALNAIMNGDSPPLSNLEMPSTPMKIDEVD